MAPHPRFAVTVMLDSLRSLDIDTLVRQLEAYMESSGNVVVDQHAANTGDLTYRISIDGAGVKAVFADNRHRPPPWSDGWEQYQALDPDPILVLHRAHVRVERSSRQPGLAAMKANAALVSIVAAAIGAQLSARGILFESAGTVLDAAGARQAGLTAIRGVSPIDAWVGICPVSIVGPSGQLLHGAATRGLADFIGHELEIAPGPDAPEAVLRRLQGMAWRVLDGELVLEEGREVAPSNDSEFAFRVHDTAGWLRPNVAAFVLVAPNSAVQVGTLAPKRADARGTTSADEADGVAFGEGAVAGVWVDKVLAGAGALAGRLGTAAAGVARAGAGRMADALQRKDDRDA